MHLHVYYMGPIDREFAGKYNINFVFEVKLYYDNP